MAYVTFLIDAGGVITGSVSKKPDSRQPDGPGIFKVICSGRRVTVIGYDDKLTQVIATARWRGGQLDRRNFAKGAPLLSTDQWTMIRNSVAEHVDQLAPAPPAVVHGVQGHPPEDRNRRNRKAMMIGFASWGVMLAIGIAVYMKCSRDEVAVATAPRTPPLVPVPPQEAARPPPAVVEPVEVRIARADTFAEAIALARPAMTDTTDEFGGGAKLFATYAASKLQWSDLDVPAETTVGHVLKDADVERGKRMCADGVIETIERRDLERRKIYVGSLGVSDGDTLVFVAVGTTGDLVKRNPARFCGVVIGRAGRSVSMVGMFDLPENRTPIVEQ